MAVSSGGQGPSQCHNTRSDACNPYKRYNRYNPLEVDESRGPPPRDCPLILAVSLIHPSDLRDSKSTIPSAQCVASQRSVLDSQPLIRSSHQLDLAFRPEANRPLRPTRLVPLPAEPSWIFRIATSGPSRPSHPPSASSAGKSAASGLVADLGVRVPAGGLAPRSGVLRRC